MSAILTIPRHRLACRALYKALLTHSRKLPCPTLQHDAAKYITKQFKKHKRIQAVKSVQQVLVSAYQHENVMRKAASGDTSCVDAVRAHLNAIAAFNKPNPPKPKPPARPPPVVLSRLEKKRLEKAKSKAKRLALHGPPPPRILRGPRIWQPQRYLIPLLSSANALPLLRRRGECTPQHIAMTIKNIIKVRQKRQDRQELLELHLEYAEGEDVWDDEIDQYLEQTYEEMQESTWAEEMKKAITYITDAMRRRDEKSRALTDKFWDIETTARAKSRMIIQERRRERHKRARHNRGRKKALGIQQTQVVGY